MTAALAVVFWILAAVATARLVIVENRLHRVADDLARARVSRDRWKRAAAAWEELSQASEVSRQRARMKLAAYECGRV